ncbi:MAG TPA: translation initiation factor [Edaphocola sp.]|nr:translation initiation factor [Edaphocola sp.]
MKTRKYNSFAGLVYSTNPDALKPEETGHDTPTPERQRLKVILDSKQRRGKTVTLVIGFEGSENDLNDLGKKLKTKCGTGGSVKDGEIIIQGDYKAPVLQWLKDWGYGVKG